MNNILLKIILIEQDDNLEQNASNLYHLLN